MKSLSPSKVFGVLLVVLLGGCMDEKKIRRLGESGDIEGLVRVLRDPQKTDLHTAALKELLQFPESETAVNAVKERITTEGVVFLLKERIPAEPRWGCHVARFFADGLSTIDKDLLSLGAAFCPQECEAYLSRIFDTPVLGPETFLTQLGQAYQALPLIKHERTLNLLRLGLSKTLKGFENKEILASYGSAILEKLQAFMANAPKEVREKVVDVAGPWLEWSLASSTSECTTWDAVFRSVDWSLRLYSLPAPGHVLANLPSRLSHCLKEAIGTSGLPEEPLADAQMDLLARFLEDFKGFLGDGKEALGSLLTAHSVLVLKSDLQRIKGLSERPSLLQLLSRAKDRGNILRPLILAVTSMKIRKCSEEAIKGFQARQDLLFSMVEIGREVFGLDITAVSEKRKAIEDGPRLLEEARQGVLRAEGDVADAERALREAESEWSRYRYLTAFVVARLGSLEYEISLPTYFEWFGPLPSSRHAILYTTATEFLTTGWFSMWVEKGDRQPVTTVQGNIEWWPTFTEVPALYAEAARQKLNDARRLLRGAKKALKDAISTERQTQRKVCQQINTYVDAVAGLLSRTLTSVGARPQ